MLRLIKYKEAYRDGPKFSNCSTKYAVLPAVLTDDIGVDYLKDYAKGAGYAVQAVSKEPTTKYDSYLTIRSWVQIEDAEGMDGPVKQYLGLIKIDDSGPLKPVVNCDGVLTVAICYDITNAQEYDLEDVGAYVDGGDGRVLVKQGWGWYHHLPLLGYSLDQFAELLNITEEGFDDDTTRCGECGVYDSRDNGYTYNHHCVDDVGMLGKNCGCYDDHMSNNWSDHINTTTSIEASAAENNDELIHMERFIAGMMDPGRGGYWSGYGHCEPCNDPEALLGDLRDEFPSDGFVITHDESGQFQSYFSIYAVVEDMSDELCDHINKLKKDRAS